MNTRLANKFDLPYYLKIVKEMQHKEWHYFNDMELDMDNTNSLFNSVIHGAGLCVVIESDETIGLCFGVLSPNLWLPKLNYLHTIIYYVEEEYRHTTAAYRLLKEYHKQADIMKQQGRFYQHTITASEPLFDIDFSRFGYKMAEKIWVMEQ